MGGLYSVKTSAPSLPGSAFQSAFQHEKCPIAVTGSRKHSPVTPPLSAPDPPGASFLAWHREALFCFTTTLTAGIMSTKPATDGEKHTFILFQPEQGRTPNIIL